MSEAIAPGMGFAAPEASRTRAFRTARRHSALVRTLRWTLPGVGLLGGAIFVLSYVASPRLASLEKLGFAVDAARLTREGVVMDHPRVTGTTAKGQPFEVRAARAWQNQGSTKVARFATIEGEIGLEGGGEAVVSAREGVYDSERETLKLSGDVRIRSSEGYGVDATEAFVDFGKGSFETTLPVVVETTDMRVEASGASGHNSERRIEFAGPVRMIVKPRSSETAQ